jgi:hypothetical protein
MVTDYYHSCYLLIFYTASVKPASMKKILCLIIGFSLVALAVMPAQAFMMKSLSITLDQSGNADMDLHYDLSFFEQSAVFFKIADPAGELQSAFNSGSAEPVTVTGATSSSAQVHVPSFADMTIVNGKTTMTTPSVSFERAEQVLNNYWFASFVTPDFSPGLTTITFPDGYKELFNDRLTIPSVTHRISS